MGTDVLPMREVLELALGTPNDGCVNLRMLHAFLRQLMISAKLENVNVNLKAFTGLREGNEAEFGAGAMIQAAAAKGGNAGDAVQDLWEYIKLKKQVETNKRGIDNLFEMAGKIVDTVGDERIVTWENLGEALTKYEPGKVTGLVRQTADGLERAKQYVKDPGKQEQLEQKKTRVLDKFDKISLAISKRGSKYDQSPSEEESDEEDDSNEEGGRRKESKKAEDSQQPKEGRIAEAGKQRDAASPGLHQQDSEMGSLLAMSESDSRSLDIEDAEFAEKTVTTLGKVALLHGANEARLNAIDEQLQNLLKFKKTASYMLQDLDVKSLNDKIGLLNGSDVKSLNELLKQLTETGGMDQLQKLIKSINKDDVDERKRMLELQEKLQGLETDAMLGGRGADGMLGGRGADGRGADGQFGADGMGMDGLGSIGGLSIADVTARMKGGLTAQARKMGMAERKIDRVSEELKSAKQEIKNLMELVADLMKDINAGKEMEGKVNELKEMANKLQEELGKQNELIMSMTEAISEYGAAIEMLKRQVRHLQEHKADKAWVVKELALKADLALLDNYITKDDFEDCLDDIGRNLGELQAQQNSLDRLLDREMKNLLDELRKKLTLDDFNAFRKNISEGMEGLKRRLDFIAGVAGGEEEAAGLRISKFHCVSCDRPVHSLAGQQPTPAVPALPGLNVSKSANPFRVLEKAKTRQIANKNKNNKGPLPDPKASNYGKAVKESEVHWRKRSDFCLNRKYGKPDPVLADRRDIFDMNTGGYYRVFSADDDCVDVWRQDRKCGGETTIVNPWQKRHRANVEFSRGGGGGVGGVGGGGGHVAAEKDEADLSADGRGNEQALLPATTNRNQSNNAENTSLLDLPPKPSESDTDEAIGVVALPVDVIDFNLDIHGLSNGYYVGNPNNDDDAAATLHPPSPVVHPENGAEGSDRSVNREVASPAGERRPLGVGTATTASPPPPINALAVSALERNKRKREREKKNSRAGGLKNSS